MAVKWKQSLGVSKRDHGEVTPKNPQPRNKSRRKTRQNKSK